MSHEVSARVHSFHFKVAECYDEREIEDLFETLENRGADYKHEGEGWYVVTIPENLGWPPFYETVKKCNSIAQVERGVENRVVSYECEPEG